MSGACHVEAPSCCVEDSEVEMRPRDSAGTVASRLPCGGEKVQSRGAGLISNLCRILAGLLIFVNFNRAFQLPRSTPAEVLVSGPGLGLLSLIL
jgi:hypothetical protein